MFKEIVVKIVYPDDKTITDSGIKQVLNYHFDLERHSIQVEEIKNIVSTMGGSGLLMEITMLVKYKGKYVSVAEKNCPKYSCFSPHYYIHKGKTIDGKSNDWTDKQLSCSHRNFHGCPDYPKKKENECLKANLKKL